MKDRRTKAELLEELLEANAQLMDRLMRSEAHAADLTSALNATKVRLVEEERISAAWSAEAQKLRKEKSDAFGPAWAESRTREFEYANELRAMAARSGVMRGALLATIGREKTDEIDPPQGGSPF